MGQDQMSSFAGKNESETAFQSDSNRKKVQQAIYTLLRTTRTPETVQQMIDQLGQQADTLVAQSPQRAMQACAHSTFFFTRSLSRQGMQNVKCS